MAGGTKALVNVAGLGPKVATSVIKAQTANAARTGISTAKRSITKTGSRTVKANPEKLNKLLSDIQESVTKKGTVMPGLGESG